MNVRWVIRGVALLIVLVSMVAAARLSRPAQRSDRTDAHGLRAASRRAELDAPAAGVDAPDSAPSAPWLVVADSIGDARPWTDTRLRDTLAASPAEVPMIDLLPALRDPASFLDRDFHLSPAGHAAVATRLAEDLR